MSNNFDVVWVNVSPSLKHFDLPLQQYLNKYLRIARWEYIQDNFDECNSEDPAVRKEHDKVGCVEIFQDHCGCVEVADVDVENVVRIGERNR
ncbi:MAG: hypothetical protein AAFR37_24855, partial [Cyanobacteria bacterium J06628_3]